MAQRSRKDTLAICGRSGIETLRSNLIQDGYMKGLLVLPEYYEPPQPIKYRPKPEMPPFNPQPLIDVYAQTFNLGNSSNSIVPYSYTQVGKFTIELNTELLISEHCDTAVGTFQFNNTGGLQLVGVSSNVDPGEFGIFTKYGEGGYGEGSYGGSDEPGIPYGGLGYGLGEYGGTADAGFDVSLTMTGIGSSSATGSFTEEKGYGVGGYSTGTYNGDVTQAYDDGTYSEFNFGGSP